MELFGRKGLNLAGWLVKWGILAALLIYIVALLGPYIRSTFVRNAAVSAWIHTATAPIYGQVDSDLPTPGSVIGADGVLVDVVNLQADRSALDRADAEARRADAEVLADQNLVQELEHQRETIGSDLKRYGAAFERDLKLDYDGTVSRLHQVEAELTLLKTVADRAKRLSSRGFVAETDRDEAVIRVTSLEGTKAELEARLSRLQLRQTSAQDGVYLMDDGSEPYWAGSDLEAVERALWHARADLAGSEARQERAWSDTKAAEDAYRLLRESAAKVPPGSKVWSVYIGEGSTVQIGDPIADWIDCEELLVDVPVADAELALLEPGMTAAVLLEGRSRSVPAKVLMTRGSGSVIGRADLAAVTPVRSDEGQVLLKLEDLPDDFPVCPVGQAAFVDFDGIGLFDVVAARLRLR